MKRNKQVSFWSRPLVLRIISLGLALFLFAYVNSGSDGMLHQTTRNNDSNKILNATKITTIKMPLVMNANTDRFVVTGYPATVEVKLNGPAALVTSAKNTKNFRVYTDVSELGVGEHTVKLRVAGLNNEVDAAVVPRKVTVKIQPRRTVVAPVKVKLNRTNLAQGYKLGSAQPSLNTVQVTGARNEVVQVDRVVAYVKIAKRTTSEVKEQVTLQAVDKHGKNLNVVVSPGKISVTVPVAKDGESSSSSSSTSTAPIVTTQK